MFLFKNAQWTKLALDRKQLWAVVKKKLLKHLVLKRL